ncbi:hypothetical protein [Priestia megaterium]|uniref:Uncharacterized protein n=1 Tax=Priestia megaterium TaxID=1404 RepID=A0A6M6E2D0_PRIMG|nr:hypothetical protein [Priestia megaterium]QJX79916.1 hypothetical protein FDZ14_27840 [Priestia megaterium]
MPKKRSVGSNLCESLADISKDQIKLSVEHTWFNDSYCKNWEATDKTYYIYEGLLKWAVLNKENHLFLLGLLLELNEQVDKLGIQGEMINKIKKAITELNE